jgi:hypothetical protein
MQNRLATAVILAAFLLALTVGLSACKSTSGTGMGSTQPVFFSTQFNGDDAGLKYADAVLVNSKADLEQMGSKDLAKKDVDFAKQSLVVVALGVKTSPGYWVRITGVQRQGDKLYVQFQPNKPAKMETPAAGTVMAPYAAVVIPKMTGVTVVPEPKKDTEGAALPQEPAVNPAMTATTMPMKR